MKDNLKEIFLNELKNNKDTPKQEIIKLAEEYGIDFKPREAKSKIIDKLVVAGEFDTIFNKFEKFGYIPTWTIADFYGVNTERIDQLHKIGAIKEIPVKREYYSRSSKSYYTVNTYPVSVLEYSREELEEAYNQTYGQEGFKFRIETNSKDEVEILINELRKLFKIEKTPQIYERRNEGYNTYFTVKLLNNSEFEQNKFLSEIESLKNKNKETEEYYRDVLSGIYKKFNVDSRMDLMRVSREYLELKEKSKKNSRGAGRKPRFTEEEKNIIRAQRKEGKTIKELAALNNCSFGVFHKILHE